MNVCVLSSYAPTRCGIASFTESLIGALTLAQVDVTPAVIRVAEASESRLLPEVAVEWIWGDASSMDRALAFVGGCDIAIVQHEYGIYPGSQGEDLVSFLRRIPIPTMVVLHTVLAQPTQQQADILDRVVHLADRVVVPTHSARARLLQWHELPPERVEVIPHGATPNLGPASESGAGPRVLTWGLIGPGKGLEYGIEAMSLLQDRQPAPTYVIAGDTHPRVKAVQGEQYRDDLKKLASDLGVSDRVLFEDAYLDATAIRTLARGADVILLPYDSRDQICSGVLVEAVSSGTPVVATAFPHAVELLSSGCGIVVPHAEPAAMARAMSRLLTDRLLHASMSQQARRAAAQHAWASVGRRYALSLQEVAAPDGRGVLNGSSEEPLADSELAS